METKNGETLTEEERASLLSIANDGWAEADESGAVAKALRCLDSALARAEAAERTLENIASQAPLAFERAESEASALRAEVERLRTELHECNSRESQQGLRAYAAESRLAAAEALLARVEADRVRLTTQVLREKLERLQSFNPFTRRTWQRKLDAAKQALESAEQSAEAEFGVRAFLSTATQPAASAPPAPCTAEERAVLAEALELLAEVDPAWAPSELAPRIESFLSSAGAYRG